MFSVSEAGTNCVYMYLNSKNRFRLLTIWETTNAKKQNKFITQGSTSIMKVIYYIEWHLPHNNILAQMSAIVIATKHYNWLNSLITFLNLKKLTLIIHIRQLELFNICN